MLTNIDTECAPTVLYTGAYTYTNAQIRRVYNGKIVGQLGLGISVILYGRGDELAKA